METMYNLKDICQQFTFEGSYLYANPYGDGHINDTYKVTYYNIDEEPLNYILQRVNHLIFQRTEELMMNVENVTSYLCDMITEEEQIEGYEVLTLVRTLEDKSFYIDENGNYWRSFVFVEEATGHMFAENPEMLYEAGKAFGQFQKMLKDYPVDTLYETIEGFHHTVQRYKTFEAILKKDAFDRAKSCQEDIEFVKTHKNITDIIIDGLTNEKIPWRVTHNDTKFNNVLLDNVTGKGRCVIDLDTVMPGSALYDYGDAIRSCASTAAEDEENLDLLHLDFERYEAYTKGFLEIIGTELSVKEFDLLPMASIIMTFECGMRFLTDYLNGDVYFKTHKEKHNLIRAKNQFKFVKEMELQMNQMKEIVNKYR